MAPDVEPPRKSAGYLQLLERIDTLEGVRLADAIPKELYEPRMARGLLGFFASCAVYVASVVALAYVPHWLFYPPLWLLAGLGGWGMFCIAHDCGHQSFSKSRRFNHLIGHLALIPLLYPFHGWRHIHNQHHASTNHIELDTDWRPVRREQYDRMDWWGRLVYWSTRSWFYFLGTINYQRYSGFRPASFAKREQRNDVRFSILVTTACALLYLPALAWFTGWPGLLIYFVGPWLAIHMWFSTTTMMHHIAEDLPFLTAKQWTPNASRLLLTMDYRYPKWLHFLTHNISIHSPHHVAPVLPFYNLPAAREALQQAFPGMLRERDFSWREVWRVVRYCNLHDPQTGFYQSFSHRQPSDGHVVPAAGDRLGFGGE